MSNNNNNNDKNVSIIMRIGSIACNNCKVIIFSTIGCKPNQNKPGNMISRVLTHLIK